jgi:cation transport protein ChaC
MRRLPGGPTARPSAASFAGCLRVIAEWPSKPRLDPPPGRDFWVFGYGSLIWKPGFPHLEVRPALLRGYHRRFCVYSHRYRGTPECPGLVLGLDRGGCCRGLVYRVPAAEGEAVMDYLYEREMVTGVYNPRWLPVETDGGRIQAAGFVVDTAHRQYAGRLSLADTAALIRQGEGRNGRCCEYLENTVRHLDALGMHDRGLHRLLRYVEGEQAA